ncbi:MAG: hypothetical protein R2699_14620 [Acidimicrobiales bacterium]
MLFAVDDHRSDAIADDLVRRRPGPSSPIAATAWLTCGTTLGVAPGACGARAGQPRRVRRAGARRRLRRHQPTPVNWHLTAEEITYILGDSGAPVIVTDAEHAPVVRGGSRCRRGRTPRQVLLVGPDLEALVAAASDAPPSPAGPAGGAMYHTSGTTGRPRRHPWPQPTLAEQLLSAPAGGPGAGHGRLRHAPRDGPLYHAAPVGFAPMDLHQGRASW